MNTHRYLSARPFVRFVLVVLTAILLLPRLACAFGLGNATGRVEIGQPLTLRIALLDASAPPLRADCLRVSPSTGEPLEFGLANASVSAKDGEILISTRTALTTPILHFSVHVDCGYNYARHYVLLPEPAGSSGESAISGSATPLTDPIQTVTGSSSAELLTLGETTTLRKLSRLRYPKDARARVRFIRSVAAENPALFHNVAAAFDQSIPPGEQLTIPPMPESKPRGNLALPGDDASQSPTRIKRRQEERLYIGASGVQVRSPADLAADIDRLANIMNEQIRIEISLVERIKQLETDVADAKQLAHRQQTELNRLQVRLEEARESETTTSHIQLGLTLLLVGLAGGALLVLRRRP